MKHKVYRLQLKILPLLTGLILIFAIPTTANAFSWKHDLVYGVMGGFGGSGVDKDVRTDAGENVTESRSEAPGMFGVSVEGFLNDKWSLALSHRRGFKFGPFSTKVSFTGVIARRYFGRAPFIPNQQLKNSATIMRRWAPFVGLGSGIATGTVLRENAVNESVSGSGVYMGIHLGADYHLSPNLILRPEFFTSGTFMNDSDTPSTLNEYGLVCGFHFRF